MLSNKAQVSGFTIGPISYDTIYSNKVNIKMPEKSSYV